MKWISVETELPPEGVLVNCLLGHSRVVEQLKRHGRLWFVPDGKMYVYYTPTHWEKIEPPKE
jgi:hypothetical protein